MKNDYIYEGKTIAPLPENFPLKEETTFRFKEEWYGHNYGVLIGEEWEDGGVTSLFAKDDQPLLTLSGVCGKRQVIIPQTQH